MLGDTIAAVASPPGRAARGIIRLSGPATRDALAAILAGPPQPFERQARAARLILDRHTLPILLITSRAPRSYTGEDTAEILLPANPTIIERTLALLLALSGLRPAAPGEFSARAYLNNKLSLAQAEGIAATIAADSAHQLAAARDLSAGRTGLTYQRWADALATLLALTEAGIDFTDQEDVSPIAPDDLRRRAADIHDQIAAFLGSSRGSEPPRPLPRIVLAGQPNAGKSTLFNALLGRPRAIASHHPGTTRDLLEEELDLSHDLPGAGPILLIDMAGIDTALNPTLPPTDAAAQARAREALATADAVIHCDPSARFPNLPCSPSIPIIRVRTKADLPPLPPTARPRSGRRGEQSACSSDAIPICALDRWNLPTLRRALADLACGARSATAAALLPRHRRALLATQQALAPLLAPPCAGPPDPALHAATLRAALDPLSELTGRITPDDILGRIFATFCIGK
jgi:tRNA modification GTPase